MAHISIGIARNNREISALDVPLSGKSKAECFEKWIYLCSWRSGEPPETPHFWFLRMRHNRPCDSRATNRGNELRRPISTPRTATILFRFNAARNGDAQSAIHHHAS